MARLKLRGQLGYAVKIGGVWAAITLVGQIVASAIGAEPVLGSDVLEASLAIALYTALMCGYLVSGQAIDAIPVKIKLPFALLGGAALQFIPHIIDNQESAVGRFLTGELGFVAGWYLSGAIASAIVWQRYHKQYHIDQG